MHLPMVKDSSGTAWCGHVAVEYPLLVKALWLKAATAAMEVENKESRWVATADVSLCTSPRGLHTIPWCTGE